MTRGMLASLLGVTLIFAAACKSKRGDNDAIRAGVLKHLAALNMLNLNNMDIKVTQATINGNQGQAHVEIRSKGGDANAAPMEIDYALEKQGDEWVVVKSTGMGGMQHPGPGQGAPSGTMPGALPPGHPNVNGGSTQKTAEQPDFNAILNGAGSQGSSPPAQQAHAAKP